MTALTVPAPSAEDSSLRPVPWRRMAARTRTPRRCRPSSPIWKRPPVEEPLRATLRMVGKLTSEGTLSARDMREVLSAGVAPEQIEDALAVCVAFNTTGRLADAFGFEVLSPEGFEAGAKYLLRRGYR